MRLLDATELRVIVGWRINAVAYPPLDVTNGGTGLCATMILIDKYCYIRQITKMMTMYIKIWAFVLSTLVAMLVGGMIGYLCRLGIGNLWKCLKSLGVSIRNRLVDYWYVLVFLVTTIYVLSNFKVCIDLSFTEDFNGNNLIFLFWLVLIIFPMFESFEGFGISIKKRKQKKTEDMLTMEYHNNLVDAQEKGGNDE